MKLRPALLLAIIVYVTLDLSLAMMPGAFQFEPADSVETVQINRAHLAHKIVLLPTVPGGTLVWSQRPAESQYRWARTDRPAHRSPLVVTWSPRAARAPAPASQDPH